MDDEDIRRKDEWTRKMQKSELQKLVELLKSGATGKELQNISFLGYSEDDQLAKYHDPDL